MFYSTQRLQDILSKIDHPPKSSLCGICYSQLYLSLPEVIVVIVNRQSSIGLDSISKILKFKVKVKNSDTCEYL